MSKCWWLCLLLALPAAAQTLRAGVASDGGEALRLTAEDAQLHAYREVLVQIAQQSGIRFELDAYPQQRLEQLFQLARLDVEVGVNPAWRSLAPVAGFYTLPLGEVEYVLCQPPGPARSGGEQDGGRVGVLANLKYPALEAVFLSRRWQRVDAGSESELVDQLRLGSSQAIVLARAQAEYWSQSPSAYRCEPGEALGSLPVMLRLHPQYRALLPRLNQAIQTLNGQGKLKPLFRVGK